MSKIIFYDATELDKQQLSDGLKSTDHHWFFNSDKISIENIDPDAEVISVFVSSNVTAEHIEKMPKLRLISCRSTGFNNVDVEFASSKDIAVVNVPSYGENTVAEYAFTLLLALTRKLIPSIGLDKETNQSEIMGSDLFGKTMGVVGTGRIGQNTIKIAKGFGMNVVGYDPFPKDELAQQLGFEYKSFDEVMAVSDYVSLHAPYNEHTHHIVNADAISKMKQSAILINTARGELVDTAALIMALNDNKIAGAGIDVVEGEALLKQSEEIATLSGGRMNNEDLKYGVGLIALSKMHNVIVTPHNAYNTLEAIRRINQGTVDNIINYWNGNVPNLVAASPKPVGKLILVRHTESEWNATGQWTGTRDIHLSERGFRQATMLGQAIKESGLHIDLAYCSEQIRTRETLGSILDVSEHTNIPIKRVGAINERDYGEYTGKNKWDMKEIVGDDKFHAIRRNWDEPIPGGETLKMVYERVVPWYEEVAIPELCAGKNILIVAHGNSLRALTKYIEDISDEDVAELEMLFGQIVQYSVNEHGKIVSKAVDTIEFGEINA